MIKNNIKLIYVIVLLSFSVPFSTTVSKTAIAGSCNMGCSSAGCSPCQVMIETNHDQIERHIDRKFDQHNSWTIEWYDNEFHPALRRMIQQFNAVMVHQVQIIGQFFDAKHRLETQRLFQTLEAAANKDYMPSEGMCVIGTGVRGLIASERKTDLVKNVYANRAMDRQLLSAETLSGRDGESDKLSRLRDFRSDFCNPADNGNGLAILCGGGGSGERRNKDIDFMRTIEAKYTIDSDFGNTDTGLTEDEQDVFALTANLFAHKVLPTENLERDNLADTVGNPKNAAHRYIDLRSVAAKRSVAHNSFMSIVAERSTGTRGDEDGGPYVKRIVLDLGVPAADIHILLGDNPSYFAQMEVMTKNIFQDPKFYTDLYDKPANVLRKGAAIRSVGLMQDRDIYNSLLRSEAVLSVLLDTMLHKEQQRVISKMKTLKKDAKEVERP